MPPSYATASQWEGELGKWRWWGGYSKCTIKVRMTRLATQFRSSLSPTFELKVFSGRQAGPTWHQEVELKPVHHVPAECCVPVERAQGGSELPCLLLWPFPPPCVSLYRSYGFSGMLASVWQPAQIHALGITLVCFEAVLVKKRFYSKLLPALGNTESSNAWDTSGHWAALISPLIRSIQTEGKVPWKVRNIPFFMYSVSSGVLQTVFAASQLNFVPRDCLFYNALFLCSCGILFYFCPYSWVLWPGGLCFSCHPTQNSNFKQKTDLLMMRDDPGVCLLQQRHPNLFLLCWSCPITLLKSGSE